MEFVCSDERSRGDVIYLLAGLFTIVALLGVVLPVFAKSAHQYYSDAVGAYVEGNHEQAKKYLDKVLKLDPDNQNAKHLRKKLDSLKANEFSNNSPKPDNTSNKKGDNGKTTTAKNESSSSVSVNTGENETDKKSSKQKTQENSDEQESEEMSSKEDKSQVENSENKARKKKIRRLLKKFNKQTKNARKNKLRSKNQNSKDKSKGNSPSKSASVQKIADNTFFVPKKDGAATVPYQDRGGTDEFSPVKNPPETSPRPPDVDRRQIKGEVRHVNSDYEKPKGHSEAVYGVTAKELGDRVRYTIKATGGVDFIVSNIMKPPMIIVDIPNSVDKLPEAPLEIGFPNNLRVRHSQYRIKPMNVTRVVIDLKNWNKHFNVYRKSPGNQIIVDVLKKDKIPEKFKGEQADTASMATAQKGKAAVKKGSMAVDPASRYRLRKADTKLRREFSVKAIESQSLTVKLTNGQDSPVEGEKVMYSLTHGGGALGEKGTSQVKTQTNRSGIAQVEFRPDNRAGTRVIEAYVPQYDLLVNFMVNVKPGKPHEIVKVSGDKQEAMFGQGVEKPITVEVRDEYGNPIPDVPVQFENITGGGLMDVDLERDGIQTRKKTNRSGRATVDLYRVGKDSKRNRLRASVTTADDGDTTLSTEFLVYGHPQLISIDFKDANLQDVLRTLAEIANWNIVLTEAVRDRSLSELSVTVHLRKVTALRALDTILDVKGLSRVSDGNVMKIVPKRQAIRKGIPVLEPEELEGYEGNNMVTVTYQLTYLSASQEMATRFKDALMAENSSIVADGNSNSLTITDLANNQKRLYKIIQNIDKPNQKFGVKVMKLTHRDPRTLVSQLRELLPLGEKANIVANPATQSILVYGEKVLVKRIRGLTKTLDKPEGGRLQEHYRFVDVSGYNAEDIARKVNAIMGL
ncbi:MAG: secretin N-terminal domain-containing protein, partial [bacterium]